MIIDPESFIAAEMSRHLALGEAAHAARQRRPACPRRPRRGLLLRLVAAATGRSAHA